MPPVRVAALQGQTELARLHRPQFRATQSKNVSSHQNKRSLPARIAASHQSARAFLYFPRPTFAPCEWSYHLRKRRECTVALTVEGLTKLAQLTLGFGQMGSQI